MADPVQIREIARSTSCRLSEIEGELRALRNEMRGDMKSLKSEARGDVRALWAALAVVSIALVGLVAARLGGIA